MFNLTTYSLGSGIASHQATAADIFADAQVVAAGGLSVARDYARAFYTTLSTERWNNAPDNVRRMLVDNMATGALACARNILADGRASYWHDLGDGQQTLACCTLIPDASGGPSGYIPITTTGRFRGQSK